MRRFTALIAIALTACAPAPVLDGSWEGEIDCGAGERFDIEFDLETQTELLFVGEGAAEGLVCGDDGTRCDVEFEIELALDEEQEDLWTLDVDMDDCALAFSNGSEDYSCPDMDDVILRDGIIEGEFDIAPYYCDMTLEP